ncbi:MAG TPA: farnesyl diphosphate synthase [Pirellulaceae bacterium]|nr:farnesyl diphosphate synthase [Pirellulaceae bacterium]
MTAAAETLDFAELSRSLRRRIDDALASYATYGADCPPHLAEAIRHSLLAPCKRLRPQLVLMSCQACGYDAWQALPAACAVEMIHTYSLIHDDLPAMDDDDLRRGRPSCHAKFGEATAILAGDALLAQAFEVLARGLPPDVAARCCGELAAAAGAENLVGGQEDDLRAQFADLGIEQLERIHRRKTGAMIRVSLRLGGIVGGADERQLAALDTYGGKLGLAFQIVDDLLDLQGDAASLGKRANKDTGRGKLTFPGLLGAAESRRRAERLIKEAIAALAPLGPRAAALESLARYVLERNS